MKNRMVVIDLDGTLVDRNGQISAEDKAAVARLVRNYVQVVLCTGRILQTTLPFIQELDLNTPNIMFDGALIYALSGRATLYSKPLQPELVKEAAAYCRAAGIHLALYSRDNFFTERSDWSDEIHHNFFHIDPTIVNFDDIWDKGELLKAEIVVGSLEDAKKAKGFADHFGGRLGFSIAHTPAYPEVEFLNIIHRDASKGAAFRFLINLLGIYPAETYAIGDGMNDISLLREVGHAVAMGDAPDEVKQVCQYITSDAEHHGVAEAINHFFPE